MFCDNLELFSPFLPPLLHFPMGSCAWIFHRNNIWHVAVIDIRNKGDPLGDSMTLWETARLKVYPWVSVFFLCWTWRYEEAENMAKHTHVADLSSLHFLMGLTCTRCLIVISSCFLTCRGGKLIPALQVIVKIKCDNVCKALRTVSGP